MKDNPVLTAVKAISLPDVLNSETIARFMGVSVSTARRWFRDGDIPGVKLGRRWCVSRQALAVLLSGGTLRRI